FSLEEIRLLRSLIETCLDDLWIEIQATDNMGYKEMLRQRKARLMKLLEALPQNQDLPLAG
ncbi:MAG: hypothetical protein ACYC11_09770, partial [Bellilinea sp.]